MSETFNRFEDPYAPSKASLGLPAPSSISGGGCWRKGNLVVLSGGGRLPPRCAMCNAPTEMSGQETEISEPSLRAKAAVTPSYCADHRRSRLLGATVGWLLLLGALFGMFASRVGEIQAGCGGLLVVAILIKRVTFPTPLAVRIDDRTIEIEGFSQAFLDSLPTEPGSSPESAT